MISLQNLKVRFGIKALLLMLCFSFSMSLIEEVNDILTGKFTAESLENPLDEKGENFEKELEKEVEKDQFLTMNLESNMQFSELAYACSNLRKVNTAYLEIFSPPPDLGVIVTLHLKFLHKILLV